MNISLTNFLSSARKQQQSRPGPVTEGGDCREEAQRGAKRAVYGERRTNQEEHPLEFSISKYVLSYNLRQKKKPQPCILVFRVGACLVYTAPSPIKICPNDDQRKMFLLASPTVHTMWGLQLFKKKLHSSFFSNKRLMSNETHPCFTQDTQCFCCYRSCLVCYDQ